MRSGTRKARIAVLLPVHDGEQFLAEAIRSVLAQTYLDFELVVVNDGSTDNTANVLSTFPDPRLRVIRLPEHRGLAEALNYGIRKSESQFIARMDADDLCMPRRFERQVAFLNAHPEVAICGTWSRTIGDRRGARRPPVRPEDIQARMFFGGAMDHPSLMVRRAFLEQRELTYSDEFRYAEDFDFLLRAGESTQLANLPEFLMRYRTHARQVSVVHAQDQMQAHARLLARQLRTMVPNLTEDEEALHVHLVRGGMSIASLAPVERWLLRLEAANRGCARCDSGAFQREIRQRWFYAHVLGQSAGLGILRSYWQSPLGSVLDVGILRHARLVANCLIASSSASVSA